MQEHKSRTELVFEAYLRQRGLGYEYEPYGPGERNPDYRFVKGKKTFLAEIKEIEEMPLDRAQRTSKSRVFTLNPRDSYDLIRRRIDSACKQLKPHKDKVDYCVVILGKRDGWALGIDELFYAMFGDPCISILMDTRTGAPVSGTTFELKSVGALRKNRPETREMYAPHKYLSAVGLVSEFNAHQFYYSKWLSRLPEPKNEKTADLRSQIREHLEQIQREWKKHEGKIPRIYKDPKKLLYRVEVIANPVGDSPLPEDVFNGRWDYVRVPSVVYE